MQVLPFVPTATAAVFVFLGLVHVYWASGGRAGLAFAIPQIPVPAGWRNEGEPDTVNAFDPPVVATLAVALLLVATGLAVAVQAGTFGIATESPVLQGILLLVSLVLVARAIGDFRMVGFFKRNRNGAFATMDSWVYSPLCVLLAAGVVLTALS